MFALLNRVVYIVGHIPPGSDERHIGLQQNGHTTFTESNNKRYLELVRKYSSIIQGQFFGHLHSDSFRIIYDDKGKPVSWMMISPSVTPRKMSVGSNNPAMRLYKFDTDSGQVLDYTQYYMDLQLANTLGEPNWVPEYNLTHYYALSDISAISLHNFVDHFTSNGGSLFAKYYRANTVRYQNEICEGVCMLNHYCAITRVDYKEFRQCLEKEQSALSGAKGRLGNNKTTVILSMIFTILCAHFQSTCNLLCRLLRLIVMRQQLKELKKHQFIKKITKLQIKLINFFTLNLNKVCHQRETNTFDKILLYHVKSIESKNYLPTKQLLDHSSCSHCYQQKAMSATVSTATKATKAVKAENVPALKQKQNLLHVVQTNKVQEQILVIHLKILHILNSHVSDITLKYLKLISILFVYNIDLEHLKLTLRTAFCSIASSRSRYRPSYLQLKCSNEFHLSSKRLYHVLLNNMLN